MQNQVEVLADDMGNVVRLSKNNPEFGYIRLGYNSVTINPGGWLKERNLTTLVMGTVENLNTYAKTLGKHISGKIVVIESFEPFNSKNPDRDLKFAGDTGIICCLDGEPIYRKTEYTLDMNKQDILIAHNNGDAIRAANETSTESVASKTKEKIEPHTTAEAFGLGTDDSETESDELPAPPEIVEIEVDDELEIEDEVEEEETFDL
tara:strand:- start:2883 stop:3500 length:618 start_codon:yes stop_codon:yes gene_type:complete